MYVVKDYKSDLYLTLTIRSVGVTGFPVYDYSFTDVIIDATVFDTIDGDVVDKYLGGDMDRWDVVSISL